MSKKNWLKVIFILTLVFAILSAALLLNRELLTFRPWDHDAAIDLPTYASGNDERTAIIENSEQSVVVLNWDNELIYKLNTRSNSKKSFTTAKFVEMDEQNNLYVLDARFGGAFEENVERVLKYSEKGEFLEELYAYQYTNEDFILTIGKINGMRYFDGSLYLIRLDKNGFYLETIPCGNAVSANADVTSAFFPYPNAGRDLVYFHISPENSRITITTKAGGITCCDFSGAPQGEWMAAEDGGSLPWTAVSDRLANIIYTDIMTSEIVFIDRSRSRQTVIFTPPPGASSYYRINYSNGRLFAASYDNALVVSDGRNSILSSTKILSSYSYTSSFQNTRILFFALGVLAALVFLAALILLIYIISQKKISETFKRIALVGVCIAFGAGISSILIINGMEDRYRNKTLNELENVSRLVTATIDPGVLTSLFAPGQYNSPEYLRFKDTLKAVFTNLQFKGDQIYQAIWMERDDVVYMMYDLENSVGIFYPYDEYGEDSYYRKATETKKYIHTSNITSEGNWLFVCGPILDAEGNVTALIETGYDMRSVQAQTREMIIQTVLIVIASAIAFLLIMIEFILIFDAYKKNKLEAASPVFRPELLRAFIFFLFTAANLATALLPMYAANLYKPLFNLPREFVVTLPFITDMAFTALALLLVPNILQKTGIKTIAVMSSVFIAAGNALCFIAPNTTFLALAYALTGFAGGALLLVINTIIGAQKKVEDVNRGFAHFNASYLAGVNVGVIFGSILAQFFPYRVVYLFSTIVAAILLLVVIFFTRSPLAGHIFDIVYQKDRRHLGRFIFKPIVMATLLLVLLPYGVSMGFTNYFMPIFGTDNGLRESNIGQLLLLSGLFAILFGTSLCEYTAKKFSLKTIVCVSLLLNLAGIYLFAANVSLVMLVLVIIILSIANIFALTNIQTYYATLYQNMRISSMKALSVYSAVENISMAIGPVVFSYMLAYDIGFGMKLFAIVLLAALLLFMLISGIFDERKRGAAKARS
jgi:predicted MFS family arabinose efflux permease